MEETMKELLARCVEIEMAKTGCSATEAFSRVLKSLNENLKGLGVDAKIVVKAGPIVISEDGVGVKDAIQLA